MNHFSEIKPVLNKLSRLNVYDSLDVVSRYMRDSLAGGSKKAITDVNSPEYNAIEVYFADFLIENIIIYSTDGKGDLSLRDLNTRFQSCRPIAELSNKVNQILNDPEPLVAIVAYINNQTNIHRPSNVLVEFYRYYRLYDSPRIREYVKDKFGYSLRQYFQISLYIYACFCKDHIHRLESYLFQTDFKDDSYKLTLRQLLNSISLELQDIKELCKDYRSYETERIFHYGNDAPHIMYPLIRCHQGYCCVMPEYILSSLLEGVYYKLDMPNASQELIAEFGHNFEVYTGDILEHELKGSTVSYCSEISYDYGKIKNQKTSDWIIWDDRGICFLDCKAKRMSREGKRATTVNDTVIDQIVSEQPFSSTKKKERIDSLPQGIEKDLVTLGISVGKILASYDEYSEGKIDVFPYKSGLKGYVCLLTIEDAYINTPEYRNRILRVAQSYRNYKSKRVIPIDNNQVKLISVRMLESNADRLPQLGVCDYFDTIQKSNKEGEHKTQDFLKEKFTKELYDPLLSDIITT